MRRRRSVKTYFHCTLWVGLIVLLLASGTYAQSRPADFGNQWVRSHPFTLAGWYGTSGDTELFAGSGQNTIVDYTNNMPTANLHLYAAIYWDLNSDQGMANAKAANPNLTFQHISFLPANRPHRRIQRSRSPFVRCPATTGTHRVTPIHFLVGRAARKSGLHHLSDRQTVFDRVATERAALHL